MNEIPFNKCAFRRYFQLIFIWYALYIITYYQITKCCIVFLTVDLYRTYFVFHILVSPCDSLSCLNDGSCRVEAGVAACFCKGDYSATTCEGTKLYIFSLPFLNYSWIFYFYLNPRAAVVMIIWYWDLQLPMQSVPITTKVVSSNTRSWWGVLNTTLCHKVCQWLATGWWFSAGNLVSSTNKTDRQVISEILLKVALNIINQTNHLLLFCRMFLNNCECYFVHWI